MRFDLQANTRGHSPLFTLLITSLVLILVSEQNQFNGGVINILVFVLAPRKFEILNAVLYLDRDKGSMKTLKRVINV